MNGRVHPMAIADDTESVRSSNSSVSGMESYLLKKQQQQTRAQPGSYVIQIPKDQIYRVPPPENAHLFDAYTRRRHRNTRTGRHCYCRRCLVWTLGVAVLALLALAAAAGVLYFMSRPKLPSYTIVSITVRGFNNLSNPEFDIAIRAENPNSNIGIDYRDGSTASVAHSGVALADGGAWPTFYQGARNVTVFAMALKGGSGVRRLSDEAMKGLREQQVPLEVDVVVPARVGLGSIRSWTFKVRVRCDVVVDRLLGGLDTKIVSESCKANAAR